MSLPVAPRSLSSVVSTTSIGRRLRRGQELQRVRADPGRRRPQRRDQVAPEGHRDVVAGVEREPRGGPLRRSRTFQPATPRATWTCRNRPVRRRGSASTRRRGPAARSAADAAPGRVVARADRASSPAGGFASASPVASVDLSSAHLAHCRAAGRRTTVDVIACEGPNACQCLATVCLAPAPRGDRNARCSPTELTSHSAHPQLPPTDRAGRAGLRDHGRGATPGRMGVHRAVRAGVHGHHPGVPRTIAGQPVAEDQLARRNRAGAEQPGARRRHWRPASDVREPVLRAR